MKIIPQRWRKSFFVILLPTLSPVKPSPITVAGTMGYSQDRSPWLVWQEWFVNHYSRAWRECDTWEMQIMCHTPADGHTAKSDKICLILITCYYSGSDFLYLFKNIQCPGLFFLGKNSHQFSNHQRLHSDFLMMSEIWNFGRSSEMYSSIAKASGFFFVMTSEIRKINLST